MTLRVALVGGPMYDGLYEWFAGDDVEIVVHGDHPSLNRAVAEALSAGERLDVISTHSKYAPSQRGWLLDLNERVDTGELAPKAVELCRFGGAQYCVPRNIDVRVLWANRELLGDRSVPSTWTGLAESGLSFAFPGRESGLFGTLFEIVTAFGGALFDTNLTPKLDDPIVVAALECLLRVARHAPLDLPSWHYDQVDAAIGAGLVALGAAWPGGTAAVRRSRCGELLEPFPYFGDASGARSYAGCHAWAVPITCGDPSAAVAFVQRLCSAEANAIDAATGTVCAHDAAFAAVEPIDAIDVRRLEITRATVASGMLTYPPMERFPAIEDVAWAAAHAMLLGDIDPQSAAAAMQQSALEVLQ